MPIENVVPTSHVSDSTADDKRALNVSLLRDRSDRLFAVPTGLLNSGKPD